MLETTVWLAELMPISSMEVLAMTVLLGKKAMMFFTAAKAMTFCLAVAATTSFMAEACRVQATVLTSFPVVRVTTHYMAERLAISIISRWAMAVM